MTLASRLRPWLAVGALAGVGCGDRPPPLPQGWLRLETAPLPLASGEESFQCYFGTFEDGGGIRNARHWTDQPTLQHEGHMGMRPIPADLDVPDGAVMDCRDSGDWWFGGTQLYEDFNLPRGAGYRIEAGQRYAIDGHYINVTDDDAEARIVVDLQIVPPDEVTAPVAAFKFDAAGSVELPPGQPTSLTFECEWHRAATIHTVSSHMHEYGRSFSLDWVRSNGTTERLLDEPDWVDGGSIGPGGFRVDSVEVRQGDIFRTTCTWDNTSDQTLRNPEEMCMAYGSAFPLDAGVVCLGGGVSVDAGDGPAGGPPGGPGAGSSFDVPLRIRAALGTGASSGGDLHVYVLTAADEPSVASWSLADVSIEQLETGIEALVEDVPGRPLPYLVRAVYDPDRSGVNPNLPSPGDLTSATPDGGLPSLVAGAPGTVELVLSIWL